MAESTRGRVYELPAFSFWRVQGGKDARRIYSLLWLDVHKKQITACVLIREGAGAVRQEIRRFGTMTRELLELADWLQSQHVTHVARESTGVYWKPVWNIL
jgi:transposase